MTESASKNQVCVYCGSKLSSTLLCLNLKCNSHTFAVGNRVILINQPDYGTGFIEKISDYKTPYEYCSDIEDEEKDSTEETLFYEKLMYHVRFRAYNDRVVSAEEIRHEVFYVTDIVRTISGLGTVKKVNTPSKLGNISYDVVLNDGRTKNFPENGIIERVHSPIESYLKNLPSDPTIFALRYFARLLYNTYTSSDLKFISNSRLNLLPHQVYIAHQLVMQYSPRYILADEVGLGKTIEAGIFVKEMISRNLAKKVLIVSPANLVNQWIFEFQNKFSIRLERFDSQFVRKLDRCDHPHVLYRTDTHLEYPFVITSLQFARMERNRELLSSLYWDIIIFDEAHHLRRYIQSSGQYKETLGYHLARKLGEKARSLLLLTATPIQLHSFDLFSLLQLIRPDIFHNFEDFESERKQLPIITMLVRNLHVFPTLSLFQKENMIGLIHDILGNPPLVYRGVHAYYESMLSNKEKIPLKILTSEQKVEDREYLKELIEDMVVDKKLGRTFSYDKIRKLTLTILGRKKLIQRLQDYHFLSNFLFRNRKRKIFSDKFVRRIVQNVEVIQTDEEADIYKEIQLYLAKTYNESVDSKNPALGFVMVVLQKLLTSSPKALISSLEKRVSKINEVLKKKQIKGRQSTIPLELQDEDYFDLEEDDWDEIATYSGNLNEESALLQKEIEYLTNHLTVLQDFLQRLKRVEIDSKLSALVEIVKNLQEQNHKIIIFTQFKRTLFYIKDTLQQLGIDVEEFHGDLDRDQKDQSVERFKLHGDVLVSTEVGGEGRNFQFCSVLINYDLPWNPMKLEQRIGRLDRIGQENDVLIFNFLVKGTVESRILEILAKRINLFTESIGNLEPIITNLEKSINKAVFSEKYDSLYDFEEEIINEQLKMEEIQAQLEDFVLDRKSFQMDGMDEIIENASHLNDEDISVFFKTFFLHFRQGDKSFGKISHLKHASSIDYVRIDIQNELRNELGLRGSSFDGVFNLENARKLEELDFFALGHPLIQALVEYCKGEDLGQPYSIMNLDMKTYLNKNNGPNPLERDLCEKLIRENAPLFVFIFETEICGIFIERIIKPVIITKSGFILQYLTKYLSKPRNFYKLIDLNHNIPSITSHLDRGDIESLEIKARKYFKKTTNRNKKELDDLNEIMFKKELQRTVALTQYKREYILNKIHLHEQRLKTIETKVPTKRQWDNVYKIKNEERRKEKENAYNSIIREIQSLNLEVDDLKKDLTEIEFDLPEDVKRLEFYRKLSVKTQLISIGFLNIQ
ncbi:MAG: DEAD/DEAH box helicase family protein [Candidatus Lokiarchaeota archaeon]|nr:DEAD/DEAH box helicase family protein [Candidatus Lokiarchaeota archaeon]